MTEAQNAKYDPAPLDPNAKGDDNAPPDPDNGKDLSYLVPNVSVLWDTPPSFNTAQPDNGGGTSPNTPTQDLINNFSVDLASLRNGEVSMLNSLRTDTSQYESLRTTVESAVADPTMYGPARAYDPDKPLYILDHRTGLMVPIHAPGSEDQQRLWEQGQQFAATINPAQEKVLESIGNALELTGSFVAMLNQAGQAYSQTDRGAKFPDPPSGSPVT